MTAPDLGRALEDHGAAAVKDEAADVEKAALKLADAAHNFAESFALEAVARALNGRKKEPAAPGGTDATGEQRDARPASAGRV